MTVQRIGGFFAPPLTNSKIEEYKRLAKDAPRSIREEMEKLCYMVEVFWETPESTKSSTPHGSGVGFVTPLEQSKVERMWDLVPWSDEVPGDHVNECEMLGRLFDGIDPTTHKPLRDAAFHLLWYAVELSKDREPMTTDKITPTSR